VSPVPEYHRAVSPRLGEILVKERACTEQAVRDALENQVIFGGRLGTNLLEIQAVTEEALARALGRQHSLPTLFGEMRLDPQATSLLVPEVADRYDAVPYALADRRLALLVVDPKNLSMLDEVAFATGKQVHPIVVPEARVWALLRRTYGIDRHLRGIDVDFAKLEARRKESAPPAGPRATVGADLMDEGAFDELYSKVGISAPPAAAPPPPAPADDVIDLIDYVGSVTPSPQPGRAPPVLPPEVVAALSANPGHAPPARLVRAAPRVEEPEPSPLGFDEAIRFLEGVDERNAIAKTVLRYARSKFRRALLLTVHRGWARGWAGLGEQLGAERVRRIQLALGSPGIVETVVSTRAHFLGPIPKTEANIRLLKALGGGVPGNALLVPILALGRVVNVFYADAGKGGVVDAGGVGELLILATRISKSYDSLLARVR
jgi:Type II secretion system (T2SS), protein E, N-terminal domain